MKQKQAGFSIIEVAIVVVLAGLVGLGGWYVWHNNKSDKLTQQSTKEQTNTQTPSAYKEPTVTHTTYSKVPSDLQQAIFAETKTSDARCIKNDAIVDYDGKATDQAITYQADDYAVTDVGCDSGQMVLFVKDKEGAWRVTGRSQEGYFNCSAITIGQAPASKELFVIKNINTGQCYEGSTGSGHMRDIDSLYL